MKYCNKIQRQYSLAFPVQFLSVIVRNTVEAECEYVLPKRPSPQFRIQKLDIQRALKIGKRGKRQSFSNGNIPTPFASANRQ